MMRWSIYQIVRKPGRSIREAIPLGYVAAEDQPRALLKAEKRWPSRLDLTQTQGGFSAIPWSKDHMSLGKLHKRDTQA